MSNDKNSQREATLMALDQLAQTLEVMNSLVRRLKLSLDQTQVDTSPAKPESKPRELENVNRVQQSKSPVNEKPTVH